MVKINKNPQKWGFRDREELPVEWFNGITSYIEFGDSTGVLVIPDEYENGHFPINNEELELKRSLIKLEGDFINNQESLLINNSDYIKLRLYLNIAPFKSFKSLTLLLNNNNHEIRLVIRTFIGTIIYNETQTGNEKIIFNLSELTIGLEELNFEITTNTNNTLIYNISIEYDILATKIDAIFKKLVKLNQNGKLDSEYLDIKYVSGAENSQGEELPVNTDTNNVIVPGNVFPEVILEDDGDLWVSWDSTDLLTQIEILSSQVQNLTDIVNNSIIPYKIGDIKITTVNTNPNLRPGWESTSWELYAQGRVLVGVNPNDSDFNVAGKTVGSKTHKLILNELPYHTHTGSIGSYSGGVTGSNSHGHYLNVKKDVVKAGGGVDTVSSYGDYNTSGPVSQNTHSHSIPGHGHSLSIGSVGQNMEHNNLQPSIAVYIWKRTG
jgi:microcystin-dependent protein